MKVEDRVCNCPEWSLPTSLGLGLTSQRGPVSELKCHVSAHKLGVPEMGFGAFSAQEHCRGPKSRPSVPCSSMAQGAASHRLSQLELRGLRYATKMHNQL